MSHYLSVGDLCRQLDMTGLPEQARAIEAAVTAGAHVLATHYDIAVECECEEGSEWEVGFGPGAGQPDKACPTELMDYDTSSDWVEATHRAEAAEEGGLARGYVHGDDDVHRLSA